MAFADNPKARDLFKKGLDQYKAQQYPEAAASLSESYTLEPKADVLFAWAQAERLAGNCDKALPLYRKLTDESSDLGTARLVHDNIARCEEALNAAKPPPPPPADDKPPEAKPPEPTPQPAPPAAPAPAPIIREVPRLDRLTTVMIAGGAAAFGLGAGLFVASVSSEHAADDAGTYDAHVDAADRAELQRTLSYVSLGVGAAMVGYAIFRITTREDPAEHAVTPVATANGAGVVFTRSW